MAPPINPAATPAATPRCAWAGAGIRHGRNSQRGDGSQCHQCLLHGLTFLVEQGQRKAGLSNPKFHISLE
jgi:hypothetical protein